MSGRLGALKGCIADWAAFGLTVTNDTLNKHAHSDAIRQFCFICGAVLPFDTTRPLCEVCNLYLPHCMFQTPFHVVSFFKPSF